MIKIYQKTIRDKAIKEINSFKVGSWIYVEAPTEEEIKSLTEKHNLEESLLRDALDPYEVPRIEIERKAAYIFTRVPQGEDIKAATAPLLIIIGENFVLTLSTKPLPFLGEFLKDKIDFTTTQKTKLFLQIFSQIVSSYNLSLNNISRRVRSVGIHLEEITNKDIGQLVRFEGILNDFLSSLTPTNTILNNLLSGKFIALYEEDRDLVEDLSLGIGQLVESCKSDLKTMVNIREAYSTIVTNNLNRIIRLLTALTVIIAIPTMVFSFFGMNVALPGAEAIGAAFWILSGTGVIGALLLLICIKNRWL
ncbi:MAG: magnesium transporter CorA family protein [Candidatus Sungbacteria bacterium]|uniref:Magnesium transporter CorA family protein n=1 Tax=Candidatus Sungiibacteriota bacterium TaxID=2750080 RepID=A0A931SDA1_9BACT|nr:magnesium transporter CorA family protein [Candidatus Sungbacteria bacterium]